MVAFDHKRIHHSLDKREHLVGQGWLASFLSNGNVGKNSKVKLYFYKSGGNTTVMRKEFCWGRGRGEELNGT